MDLMHVLIGAAPVMLIMGLCALDLLLRTPPVPVRIERQPEMHPHHELHPAVQVHAWERRPGWTVERL